MKKTFLIIGAGLILTITGCQNSIVKNEPSQNNNKTQQSQTPKVKNNQGKNIGMANPASTNCIDKSGKIEIRRNKKGEYGVCLFEDNRQCEEWALFRNQCPEGGLKITGYENDAEIYCAITGGQVEGVGTETPMCKRFDGTYCNAQTNLDGECPDLNDSNPDIENLEIE